MRGFAFALAVGIGGGVFASARAEAMPAHEKPCDIQKIDARNPFGATEPLVPTRAGCHHARRLDVGNPFADGRADAQLSAELELAPPRLIETSNPFAPRERPPSAPAPALKPREGAQPFAEAPPELAVVDLVKPRTTHRKIELANPFDPSARARVPVDEAPIDARTPARRLDASPFE